MLQRCRHSRLRVPAEDDGAQAGGKGQLLLRCSSRRSAALHRLRRCVLPASKCAEIQRRRHLLALIN